MNKSKALKKFAPLVVFVLGSIVLIIFSKNFIGQHVCVNPRFLMSGEVVPSGIIFCYSGKIINDEVLEYARKDSKFSQAVDLVSEMSDPMRVLRSGRIDFSGISDDDAIKRISLIYDAWGKIKSKKVIFYVDFPETSSRKYVFSGFYNQKPLVFEIEVTLVDNEQVVFLVEPSNSVASKFLGYWEAYASNSAGDSLYLGALDFLRIFTNYRKVCVGNQFCVFYEEFVQAADVDQGLDVWQQFLEGFKNRNVEQISSSMDFDSLRRLGLKNSNAVGIGADFESLSKTFLALDVVGYVKSGDSLVAFVRQSDSERAVPDAFHYKEVQPVIFYWEENRSKYIAIELNKISIFTQLLSEIDFSDGNY